MDPNLSLVYQLVSCLEAQSWSRNECSCGTNQVSWVSIVCVVGRISAIGTVTMHKPTN